MIKVGFIFKQVDIIKILNQDYVVCFLITTPVLVLFVRLMHLFMYFSNQNEIKFSFSFISDLEKRTPERKINNTSTGENDTRISEVSAAFPDGDLIAYDAYLSGTITFGGPGNLLVLLIYLKSGPVSRTDWFIIFISIYDLIPSLISVPVYLTFSTGTWRHYGNDVICKFHTFARASLLYCRRHF